MEPQDYASFPVLRYFWSIRHRLSNWLPVYVPRMVSSIGPMVVQDSLIWSYFERDSFSSRAVKQRKTLQVYMVGGRNFGRSSLIHSSGHFLSTREMSTSEVSSWLVWWARLFGILLLILATYFSWEPFLRRSKRGSMANHAQGTGRMAILE